MMIVKPALARGGRDNKIPSVKLLETVTGPSATGLVAMDGHGMGLMERAMSNLAGAILIAAALLCSSGQSQAQPQAPSSGNGISNFFGNIFSGPKSGPAPQAAPGPDGGPAAPLERRGRRLRPPPDDGFRDPGGGCELSKLRCRDVA